MTQSFSLGVRKLWNELSLLQSPGFYWVNIAGQLDASLFCQQLIGAQNDVARVSLICCAENQASLPASLFATKLKQFSYYFLPENKLALLGFTDDLMRALKPKKRLLILYAPAGLWGDFSQERLQRWVTDTGAWLQQRECTLIILSHGGADGKLRNRLISQHRALYGLASLHRQQDRAQYWVSWWSTELGMVANQTQILRPEAEGWQVVEDEAPTPAPFGDDEGLYLAQTDVLEGAPALSASWRLFADHDALARRGMSAHAATLIFSLRNAHQVDDLAREIHRLRSQRGDRLKIVVREMRSALRSSDERLLLACGANLIVAHAESLSRFLTRLESVQGQHFTRRVPTDIETLLTVMRPLKIKGYLPTDRFTRAVQQLMGNALIPEGSKGLLVALYPVPGLLVAQALTICNLRRSGDVVTLSQGRLLLFLSTCGINELDTALKSIFSLPVNEIFSRRAVWAQDLQILAEIKALSECREDEVVPLINHYVHAHQHQPEQKVGTVRRQPAAITLFTGG
ncbi:cellulose biosynthesis protein BcsE [Brenneria sp. g21c3]|uniref:cellulose biosynthesis protein BcsE n=1 Tax=Brenneria sp. g21c3 TaxID=3093893 RepID=UPI002EC26DF8|nr:cellulose biosynthesis protein BcsE [Brenneria sp. g21c3]